MNLHNDLFDLMLRLLKANMQKDAATIHAIIGTHSTVGCPICNQAADKLRNNPA